MYAYSSAGKERYDEMVLLYRTTDVDRRSFRHDDLWLHVRLFDARVIYDFGSGRLDEPAAVKEMSRALSDDRTK
jgi:hypothetical protein